MYNDLNYPLRIVYKVVMDSSRITHSKVTVVFHIIKYFQIKENFIILFVLTWICGTVFILWYMTLFVLLLVKILTKNFSDIVKMF